MKHILIFVMIITHSLISTGQTTKNNFLVGGNGRITSQKQTLNSENSRTIDLNLKPQIGYFFVDKFSAGISTTYSFTKTTYSGSIAKSEYFGFGPFCRYYFLDNSNQINFFAESAYQFINESGNNYSNKSNLFSLSAGPVIFLNSNIGVEITGNYDYYKNNSNNIIGIKYSLNIGFKIHLEHNDED
jgi:hypothetical protein